VYLHDDTINGDDDDVSYTTSRYYTQYLVATAEEVFDELGSRSFVMMVDDDLFNDLCCCRCCCCDIS